MAATIVTRAAAFTIARAFLFAEMATLTSQFAAILSRFEKGSLPQPAPRWKFRQRTRCHSPCSISCPRSARARHGVPAPASSIAPQGENRQGPEWLDSRVGVHRRQRPATREARDRQDRSECPPRRDKITSRACRHGPFPIKVSRSIGWPAWMASSIRSLPWAVREFAFRRAP